MKKEIIISIMAAAALCGCQKEEQSIPDSNSKPFIATIDDSFSGAETKTSLDSQGNVLWKKGDQISIFAGSTINEQWQVTDASDGKTAAGLNKVSGAGFNAGGEIDNNVAFYPYSSENTIAKSEGNYVIGIVLPSTQNYAEASFGNGAFPMAAVTSSTTDMNLKFKNILGGLKLQLKGTATIASISISGNNDEILCGAANVTASASSKPSISLTDESANTVTLDCGDGVQLDADAATSFVIALPPMTMTGGFTVTVTDTEGKQMEIKTTKSQTITRSSILKMPAVDYVGEAVPQKPENGISGIFSVSNENRVYFAKGNLQVTYNEVTHKYEWGFAENQYDIIGDTEGNASDLFGWSGHSHFNYGNSTQTNSSYYDGYFLDWGVKIDNEGTWRTLSEAEWSYLLGTSPERDGKYKNWVNVNGVNGLVIAPDIFSGTIADSYTSSTWAIAEQDGLVFLPISGNRYGNDILDEETYGYYWSGTSTSQWAQNASIVCISSDRFGVSTYYRRYGCCVRLVSDVDDPSPIDLGLSVKWANCNVGARTPYGLGNYYAWGDTEGHVLEFSSSTTSTNFNATYYKYSEGEYPHVSMSKYNDGDGLTILDSSDDVATINWGNSWRIPTNEEMEELTNTDNCSWVWYNAGNTEFNGVAGYKVQSLIPGYTDNYIFLPAAGWWQNNDYKEFYTEGIYWTSSLNTGYSAHNLEFTSSSFSGSLMDRFYGCSVRPVYP